MKKKFKKLHAVLGVSLVELLVSMVITVLLIMVNLGFINKNYQSVLTAYHRILMNIQLDNAAVLKNEK